MVVHRRLRDAALLETLHHRPDLVAREHEIPERDCLAASDALEGDPTAEGERRFHLHIADHHLEIAARKSELHDTARVWRSLSPEGLRDGREIIGARRMGSGLL